MVDEITAAPGWRDGHTPQVMAGAAPAAYRRAADRLALAVKGLPFGGGINTCAISVIGTSMHSTFPQYRYLDQPKNDLGAITRQPGAQALRPPVLSPRTRCASAARIPQQRLQRAASVQLAAPVRAVLEVHEQRDRRE